MDLLYFNSNACVALQVLRESDNDLVTVIGAGVTLHEALAAYDILKSEGRFKQSSFCVHAFYCTMNCITKRLLGQYV